MTTIEKSEPRIQNPRAKSLFALIVRRSRWHLAVQFPHFILQVDDLVKDFDKAFKGDVTTLALRIARILVVLQSEASQPLGHFSAARCLSRAVRKDQQTEHNSQHVRNDPFGEIHCRFGASLEQAEMCS